MKKQTLGMMITTLRKKQGMTQLELAEKMGVTDKAVSKWERDLSCPDIKSVPKLAEIFDVSIEELMQTEEEKRDKGKTKTDHMILLICKAVALAMGIAVIVLSALNQLDIQSGFGMLGVGLTCLSIYQFKKEKVE